MDNLSFGSRRGRRESAAARSASGALLLLALLLLPAGAATAGPAPDRETFAGGVQYAEAGAAEKRQRERAAERAETRRREEKLDRLEAAHNAWRRRLEILQRERRYEPRESDVPVYNPRPGPRR